MPGPAGPDEPARQDPGAASAGTAAAQRRLPWRSPVPARPAAARRRRHHRHPGRPAQPPEQPRPGHHARASTSDPPGGDIHLARSHSRDHLTSPASRRGFPRLVQRRQAADLDQLQAGRPGPASTPGEWASPRLMRSRSLAGPGGQAWWAVRPACGHWARARPARGGCRVPVRLAPGRGSSLSASSMRLCSSAARVRGGASVVRASEAGSKTCGDG